MITRLYNIWYDIKETVKDRKGQGMVEYALIIGLVAVLLVGGLTLLKDDIAAAFTKITTALPN